MKIKEQSQESAFVEEYQEESHERCSLTGMKGQHKGVEGGGQMRPKCNVLEYRLIIMYKPWTQGLYIIPSLCTVKGMAA